MTHAEWIDRMRGAPVLEVATALGYSIEGHKQAATSHTIACPACAQSKRHTRTEPDGRKGRGAVGIHKRKPYGWRCFQCDAHGDAITFASFAIAGASYKDLRVEHKAKVREWCQQWTHTAPTSSTPAPEPPRYPLDVAEFYAGCVRVDEDEDVRRYLLGRSIDAGLVADLDLARALPVDAVLPRWARTWAQESRRLIVPLYDPHGVMRSVIGRSIDREVDVKSKAPYGFDRAGLVMACSLGQQLLQHGQRPEWWPADRLLTAVIVEGEPDYLSAASQWSDAAEYAPATFGFVEGAWSEQHASRIPDGSRVVLVPHLDESGKGERYADAITKTFAGRVHVQRFNVGTAS